MADLRLEGVGKVNRSAIGVQVRLRLGEHTLTRQVEGATVGVTANQGLFGHGSSVIVAR